jgi:PPK2 family polyphosphate:nucleotide phosphotransferase
MAKKHTLKQIESFISPYKITNGKGFSLKQIDPDDTHGLGHKVKDEAKELLRAGIERMAELQDKLYAHDRWGVLLIFQAMDAAGKDGTIKHVMSGLNPQGCQVYSFKQPSAEELDHDYMWRYMKCMPERGRIGIFNRSYYEEVLVLRVHKELLQAEKIPPELITKNVWDDRLEDIAAFERYMAHNGIVVVKFYLHLSHKEQKKRFMARLDDPDKNWKFSTSDVRERQHWGSYMDAYEAAIKATATQHSPWYVVPADNKWFTRLVVGAAVMHTLEKLKPTYPVVGKAKKEELVAARQLLLSKGG